MVGTPLKIGNFLIEMFKFGQAVSVCRAGRCVKVKSESG